MARTLVSIDSRHHEFYRQLAGRDKELVFDSMKDLFLICAALGFRNGVPVELTKKETVFDTAVFSHEEWVALEAAYLATTKDIDGLTVEAGARRANEKVLDCAERYANAGIAILKDEFDPRRPEIDLALLLLRAPSEATT